MTIDFKALSAPFAPEAIHWRAQSVAGNGGSALALAYIDARDVMARLDDVCGPENWQDRYTETIKGRVICTISLRVGDEWIAKEDGAGSTDVEGDKGAISDALKRCAVKWGIGRYLYDFPDTWAECETYEQGGKKKWKKWTPAGLTKLARVAGGAAPKADPAPDPAPRSGMITDEQRDELMLLCEAAGVLPLTVCETYSVKDFRELTTAQFEAARKRLNLSIDAKVQQAEAKAA